MTPTATTPAGRKTENGRSGTGGTAPDHRRKLRQPPSPRAPRRVSGPVGGRAASVPRPPQSPRPRTRPIASSSRSAPLVARARSFVRSLPDHAVIDRLVRGRVWILALGVMLAGIVAMQVEVLKLGASIGRSVQRSSVLSVRNEQLQASVASLADDQRIERLAAGMGMVMAPPGAAGFLDANQNGNLASALRNLQAPNATSFMNSTSTNGVVVTPTSLAAANASSAASSSGTSSTTTPSSAPLSTTPTTTYAAPTTASTGATGASSSTGATASTVASSSGAVAASPAVSAPTNTTPTGG
jgi:hypothetical protein